MSEKISGRELAKRLGVNEAAVRKSRKRGLLRPGRDGLYDYEESKALWATGRDPDAVLKGQMAAAAITGSPPATSSLPEGSLTRARTAVAALKAEHAQIALAKAKGELISRNDAKAACLAVVHEIKTRLDGLPSAAAPVVHAAPTVAEAEALLRGMVRAVLVEVGKLGDAV